MPSYAPKQHTKVPPFLHHQVLGQHLRVWSDRRTPISWDELQSVKNEVFGEDAWAIEVYPPESEVVDEAPFRHLWLVESGPNLRNRP